MATRKKSVSNLLWMLLAGMDDDPLTSFIFTVNIAGDSETFTIPCQDVGVFNATIDWGDSSASTVTAYNDANLAHTYDFAGDYVVEIKGTFPNIYFNNGGDCAKLTSVRSLGDVGWLTFNGAFYGCSNITSFKSGSVNTSSVTDMYSMFREMTGLTSPPDVSGFDTSSVTSMYAMFYNMSSLTSPPDVSGWDTSSVTNMSYMFFSMSSIASPPDVSSWDTGSVTDMYAMFHSMTGLTSPPDVSSWDTSSVTDVRFLFYNMTSLTSPPDVSSWDTSSVTSMYTMFYNMTSITSPPDVSSWDTSSVTDMRYMFYNMSSVASPPDVSGFDTSSVTNMRYMFYNMAATITSGVSSFDIGALTDATSMFISATMSTSEYDNVLINWEGQAHQNNVVAHFGSSTYTSGGAAETARTALVGDGWTITDGGAA